MTALTLFNLATEYRQTADQLADMDMDLQTMSDTLEGMSGDLETKATNVAYMVRNFEVSADAIKTHAQTQLERARAIEKRADHLRDYLKSCMELAGITKIEGPGVVISFRKSEAVVINEPGLVPSEYMRTPEPPPPQPDKTAIKTALKAGQEVPGAHLDVRQNLQIK
jgi:uncharacterized protein YlxW (UPF0749 family)